MADYTNENDYIAKCPECQHVCGWMSSRLSKKDLAKEVSQWIRLGFNIERVTTAVARTLQFGHREECKQESKNKK